MSVKFSAKEIQAALNADTEFRFAARYWDGALQLQVGNSFKVLRLQDGEVVGTEETPLARLNRGEVSISAPVDDWTELVRPFPRPFFEDFNAAMMHHGFELKGDADYIWAYYAALRRFGQVLRGIASIEEA